MEKKLHINKAQTIYIPDDLFAILSEKPIALPNAYAVVLYNPKLELDQIKRSIEIILEDIKHRIEINKNLETRKETT